MNKSLSFIVTLVLLFIFSSAKTSKITEGQLGYQAPNFIVSNEDTTMSLQHLKGKYVLLTFWSSFDAESRINNIEYDKIAQQTSNNLNFISINYDLSRPLYNEIISRDKLKTSSQFYDQEGNSSKIFENYHLDQGFKSYLINPAGEIIAMNPGKQELTQLLRQ